MLAATAVNASAQQQPNTSLQNLLISPDVLVRQRNLPDPNGALLKADVGGPGGNLQFVSDERTRIRARGRSVRLAHAVTANYFLRTYSSS